MEVNSEKERKSSAWRNMEHVVASCIIQKNPETRLYAKDYNQDCLAGILNEKDLFEIIDNCNRRTSEAYLKKKANEQIKLPRSFIWLSLLAILLAIVYMVALGISSSSQNYYLWMIIAGVFFIGSAVISFLLAASNFSRKLIPFQNLRTIIREGIEKYLSEVNLMLDAKESTRHNLFFRFLASSESIEILTFKHSDLANHLDDEEERDEDEDRQNGDQAKGDGDGSKCNLKDAGSNKQSDSHTLNMMMAKGTMSRRKSISKMKKK